MELPETFLACPFCGGTNILVSSPGIGMVQPRHFVAICTNDVGKPGCGSSSTWKLVPAEAREAWNRRAGAGRASQDNGGKQLVSSAWLDALAVRWERRIAFLENGCSCDPQSYHRGLIDAHGDCLKDLRADMESASNGADERPAPARED